MKKKAGVKAKSVKQENKIKGIIATHLKTPAEKLKNTDTIESLGGDSLDFVELILAIEEEFQFLIPAEDADKFTNIGELINHVKENLKR